MSAEGKLNLKDIKVSIIGSLSLKQSLVSYYLRENGECECAVCEDITTLPDINSQEIDVVLWDVHALSPPEIIRWLKRYENDINFALGLLDISPNFGLEPMALRLRVRGFFYEGDPIKLLPKGISQMCKGHLWVPRDVLERCLMEETDEEALYAKSNNRLTMRQEEVLRLILDGYRNTDIADKLQVSTNTVKAHLYQAYKKINANSRWQAAKWAESNLI